MGEAQGGVAEGEALFCPRPPTPRPQDTWSLLRRKPWAAAFARPGLMAGRGVPACFRDKRGGGEC